MSHSIYYVGPIYFPNGGAAARRIHGICKSMQAAGFEMKVACGQMLKGSHSSQSFDGVEIYSLNERTAEYLPRFLKHFAYLTMGRKTIAWLETLETKPHAVVLYSGYSPYLFQLLPWARKNNVKLVFDAVEWYDPTSIMGWFSPYQLNIELAMRLLLPRVGHVISISDYLHRYYTKQGCKSVVVPPTLDVEATPARLDGRDHQRPLELVYSGSPGRKDLLNNIIEAVLLLRLQGHALHLSVAGVTVDNAQQYAALRSRSASAVSEGVTFLGLLSHQASMHLVRQADFSLLLRHDARYSKAGFPTKFVESLSVGTPVIANLTSDLHRYLLDGKTGYVCAGPAPSDLVVALKRALSLTKKSHAEMRANSRFMAVESFDYRAFVSPLSEFFGRSAT